MQIWAVMAYRDKSCEPVAANSALTSIIAFPCLI